MDYGHNSRKNPVDTVNAIVSLPLLNEANTLGGGILGGSKALPDLACYAGSDPAVQHGVWTEGPEIDRAGCDPELPL